MPREIRLNAFDMACIGHIQHGMWTPPRDRSTDYRRLDYWTGLARTLERGLFDGLFLADVVGIYDVLGASPDAAIRHAVQVPLLDPMLVVPAMAAVTSHLGFGVTVNLTYEAAALFARRFSTLDHLTPGRMGGSAGTSSPATSTAPPAPWGCRRSWRMTPATTPPRISWPPPTGC